MKYLLLHLIFFLALIMVGSGCTKEEIEPGSGAITGTIKPMNAARAVYLVSETDTMATIPTADGTFEMTEIKAGYYQLGVLPVYGFKAPASGRVKITDGFTMKASPIRLESLPENGLFTVTVNDSVFSGSPTYPPLGPSGFSVVSNNYTFRFELPKISGPDSLNTASEPNLKLWVTFKGMIYEANRTQGNAGLKVTYFDKATKRGDAVFSFKAVNGNDTIYGTRGSIEFMRLQI